MQFIPQEILSTAKLGEKDKVVSIESYLARKKSTVGNGGSATDS